MGRVVSKSRTGSGFIVQPDGCCLQHAAVVCDTDADYFVFFSSGGGGLLFLMKLLHIPGVYKDGKHL